MELSPGERNQAVSLSRAAKDSTAEEQAQVAAALQDLRKRMAQQMQRMEKDSTYSYSHFYI